MGLNQQYSRKIFQFFFFPYSQGIEAENLETAVQKIKDLCADGQLDELSNADLKEEK